MGNILENEHDETIWLAAILEGEGCFDSWKAKSQKRYPRIRIVMTDEDVVARAAGIIGNGYHRIHTPFQKERGWQPKYEVQTTGENARRLMRRVLPYMGKRRSEKIVSLLKE